MITTILVFFVFLVLLVILSLMIRLPAALEHRLEELFPRVREREHFVADAVEMALEKELPTDDGQPAMVGGTLHLFSDGGSRGNPGQAAIGYIIEDPVKGEILTEHGETIGTETNNVAEYQALIAGLRAALKFHPNRLICHLDSELVVKQLNGEYRVKMPSLQQYVDDIQELAQEFSDIVFQHIPREDNWRADKLVNEALDAAPKQMPRPIHPPRLF